MKSNPFHKALLLLLYPLIGQFLVLAIASGSTIPDNAGNINDETPGDTDTCEWTKASTYTRTFSQQWTINNFSAYWTNRTYQDDYSGVLATSTLDDQFGANWTFELSSPYRDELKILFSATFTDDGRENPVHEMWGTAVASFDGNFTTNAFICSVESSDRLENSTILRKGSGTSHFLFEECQKLAQTDSIAVTLQLTLVYSNISREMGKGRECQALKLEAFKRSRFVTPKNNEGFKTQDGQTYLKVRKHKVSLEWSIPDLYAALRDIRGLKEECLQSLKLTYGMDSKMSFTEAGIDRDSSGKKIRVWLELFGMGYMSGVSGFQVGVTTGQNYTKEVPQDGITGGARFKKANFLITDDDLEQWKQGVVVLLQYVIVSEA